jgi:hypothetical protein
MAAPVHQLKASGDPATRSEGGRNGNKTAMISKPGVCIGSTMRHDRFDMKSAEYILKLRVEWFAAVGWHVECGCRSGRWAVCYRI